MSTINTNGIDANYPVAGVNNNSQGFRDNFASIKTNLNTAGIEIADLQNKAVVKQALTGTVVNNDMANTLISNATTRSFRASTYNLGNDLSGTVLIDVSLGDVQYGTITGNTTLQFGSWAPTNTQSNVQLSFTISNSSARITFPSELAISENSGGKSIENYSNVGGLLSVSAPYGVTELDYRISTLDCGTTLTIEPYNRPRIASQVQSRTPTPIGYAGDVAGDIAVDANYIYICTGAFDSTSTTKTATVAATSSDEITLNNVTNLVTNNPIVFTGTVFGGVAAGTVYYIKSIVGANTAITISATRSGGAAGSTFNLTDGSGTMSATSYYGGTDIWKRTALATW